ncbi:unnamed protein product [Rotaria sp. Silwood1]|nr:unnamed protein product [Rotaria sp. Silwood1]CAF3687052.1 unnamed protein product [Rotaria sp. Silwood1]CAF3753513.1 unnamed protein product [Rotaria sp. Silwood1]CAF4640607.1 unnamed protein product [Rotaria sp. Silwood1]CAF4735280.1 unnamed protein product [Rotaria sp. Silwood1]
MSNQRLTTGALLRYLRGNTSEKAILQVVGIKTIDSKTDDPSTAAKRYRLMLSDGKSTFSSCMLGTQMNKLIEMNTLKENSIVRIDRVMVNAIDKQSGRVMLMLHEVEVLQSDSERIGEPVALPLTDIINNDGNANRRESTDNNQTSTITTTAAAPATNVIRQGSKVLPTLDDRNDAKNFNGDNNRASLKGGNAIDKERIITIDTLNPYMNKWTIKARVSNKSQIRNYQNARGPGKLFSCDLVDQSGEIRAAAFNTECDKFHSLLEVGKVYYIARASLKPANRQFNSLNNDYEMTFNYDTCIEPCDADEGQCIPQVQFNFIPISEIANRPANSICDVIGVVKSASNIDTIVSKASQKEFNKRDLLLVDENTSIAATLWGQQAEDFDGSSNPVVAFKGIRIGDFNGRTLSTVSSTLICLDPIETPRTIELRNWFDKEGKSIDLPDLSKGGEIGNQQAPFKTFSQITAEGLGLNDKPDYINVKAIITVIKKDTAVYMMCPEERCGKKVVDENNGTFRCEKCNKTYNNFKWSYMVSAEISDATGAQWMSAFRNEAEALLGISADEFGNHKLNQNENTIDDILQKVMNRERVFKLRAKADQYNDERRIRFTCMRVSDVDWSSHGRRLIEEINQMETIRH